MLGNYGGEDKGPSPEQVRLFEDLMKKAGKPVDVKIYPGAGHAFANVNNPWGGYRKEAAEDAWARTKAFLAKYLKAGDTLSTAEGSCGGTGCSRPSLTCGVDAMRPPSS